MSGPQVDCWRGSTTSVEQTRALGRAVAAVAGGGDLIALFGELGTGKTQLVKGLAQGLGLDPAAVSSPTFVLVHEHELAIPPARVVAAETTGGRRQEPAVLLHVDAYRLDTAADLESIGWGADLSDAAGDLRHDALVAVEWADRLERLPGAIGPDRLEVHLSHGGSEVRLVECRAWGRWRDRSEQLSCAFDRATANVEPA